MLVFIVEREEFIQPELKKKEFIRFFTRGAAIVGIIVIGGTVRLIDG